MLLYIININHVLRQLQPHQGGQVLQACDRHDDTHASYSQTTILFRFLEDRPVAWHPIRHLCKQVRFLPERYAQACRVQNPVQFVCSNRPQKEQITWRIVLLEADGQPSPPCNLRQAIALHSTGTRFTFHHSPSFKCPSCCPNIIASRQSKTSFWAF